MRGYKKPLKNLGLTGACILGIFIVLQASFGTINPFYVVSSGSMIPELEVYDLIVVQANRAFAEVQVGDVIVYERPVEKDRVIVHRVASIMDEEPKTIQTKGDANPNPIPGTDFPITKNEYRGTVLYVIPQAGYISHIFQPPITFVLIGLMATALVFKKFKK